MSSPQHPTPPIVTKDGIVIGFITHRSFDSLNIQPVIGTVITAFKENEGNHPTFIFHSNDRVVNYQFVDALNAWHIDPEHYVFLQDSHKDYANGEYDDNHAVNSHIRNYKMWRSTPTCKYDFHCESCSNHCGMEIGLMKEYKKMIDVYQCDVIYVFADNHRANEIRALVGFAKMYKDRVIRIITIDSNGDFKDLTNPNNPKNFRTLYGRYSDSGTIAANQGSFTAGKYWRSRNWTAEGSNDRY